MSKKNIILLFVVTFALLFCLSIFFGLYSVEVFKNKNCLVRKVENHNMFFNFLKPSANSVINTGDLIVFKNPELLDPKFNKRNNILSRVIAKPGEMFNLKNAEVFINDNLLVEDYKLLFLFRISTQEPVDFKILLQDYDVEIIDVLNQGKACNFITSHDVFDEIVQHVECLNVRQIYDRHDWADTNVFPKQYLIWNKDNFGPIIIPYKGQRISFNQYTVSIYKRIIDAYEGHHLYVSGDKVFIDDVQVTEYTIEKNYYFVLNDNRFLLKDSRSWGFLPEDFIVGKLIN